MLQPANRRARKATWSESKAPDGRWRAYDYAELVARDKASLDVFWLKDEALEASANLPASEVIAARIFGLCWRSSSNWTGAFYASGKKAWGVSYATLFEESGSCEQRHCKRPLLVSWANEATLEGYIGPVVAIKHGR